MTPFTLEVQRQARSLCTKAGDNPDTPRWVAYVEQARAMLMAKAAASQVPVAG